MALPDSIFGRIAAVEEREVTLGDGTKRKLHFRSPPRVVWFRFTTADAEKEPDKWEAAANALIASTLVEPDPENEGQWKTVLPADKADALTEVVWWSFLSAAVKWHHEKADAAGKA